MVASKLTLNLKMSKILMINKKLHDKKNFGDVVYNKSEICQSFLVKYLEILIDKELNFKKAYHISFAEAKVLRGVGILFKTQAVSSYIYLIGCVIYSLFI